METSVAPAIADRQRDGMVKRGGECFGADMSSWGAEMTALERTVRAAQVAECNVALLIDNMSVQKSFKLLLQGTLAVPKFGFGRWKTIKQLIWGLSHSSHHVPSHNKHKKNWTPDSFLYGGNKSGDKWRLLNAAADSCATIGMDRATKTAQVQRIKRQTEEAHDWSLTHMRRLQRAVYAYVSSAVGVLRGNYHSTYCCSDEGPPVGR